MQLASDLVRRAIQHQGFLVVDPRSINGIFYSKRLAPPYMRSPPALRTGPRFCLRELDAPCF